MRYNWMLSVILTIHFACLFGIADPEIKVYFKKFPNLVKGRIDFISFFLNR